MDMKRLEGVVYAQGWLGSQIKSMSGVDAMTAEVKDKWKTIDAALDELIRENREQKEILDNVQRSMLPYRA